MLGKKVVVETPEKYTRTVNVTTPYITVVLTSEHPKDTIDELLIRTNVMLEKYKKYHITDNREDIRWNVNFATATVKY